MNFTDIMNDMDIKEYVTETAKATLLVWLKDTMLPQVKDFVEKYKAELKSSSKEETGWNKFRDAIFLPLVFNACIWLFETALNKIVEKTATEKE